MSFAYGLFSHHIVSSTKKCVPSKNSTTRRSGEGWRGVMRYPLAAWLDTSSTRPPRIRTVALPPSGVNVWVKTPPAYCQPSNLDGLGLGGLGLGDITGVGETCDGEGDCGGDAALRMIGASNGPNPHHTTTAARTVSTAQAAA